MSGLAGQQSETDDPQIAAFAFSVSAPGQLARRYGGDGCVEVGRIEGEDIGRKLEPGHRSRRDRHLRLLEGVLGDLLRYPMKSLTAERGARQTRQTRHAGIQKVAQVAFGPRRAGSLNGDRYRQLADGGAVLRAKVAARPVNVRNQIQLLGNPDQGPHVADAARAHRARGAQIRDRWGCRRPQHDLARNRATAGRIPNSLGCDSVATTVDFTFKYMHFLSCSMSIGSASSVWPVYARFSSIYQPAAFKYAKVGLERPAKVLESCQMGKLKEAHANNDKISAIRIGKAYLAGTAKEVWVPDLKTQEWRDWFHAYTKATKRTTQMQARLRSYLSDNGVRLKKGTPLAKDPQIESKLRTARDWSSRQWQVIEIYLAELRHADQQRRHWRSLIAQEVLAEPELRAIVRLCGVREIVAFALGAFVGDIQRFAHPKKLVKYVGLNPAFDDTGETEWSGGIGGHGHKLLRGLLIEGAQAILRSGKTPLARWGKKLLASKGSVNLAVAAIARKLTEREKRIAAKRRKRRIKANLFCAAGAFSRLFHCLPSSGLLSTRRIRCRRRTNPTIAMQRKDAGEGFPLRAAIALLHCSPAARNPSATPKDRLMARQNHQ